MITRLLLRYEKYIQRFGYNFNINEYGKFSESCSSD